jgi:hypothetical protein
VDPDVLSYKLEAEKSYATDSEKNFSKQLQGNKSFKKRSAFPVARLC